MKRNNQKKNLVCEGFKEPAIIRKSTLLWLLSDTKLSSDRLVRLRAAPVNHIFKNKMVSASCFFFFFFFLNKMYLSCTAL